MVINLVYKAKSRKFPLSSKFLKPPIQNQKKKKSTASTGMAHQCSLGCTSVAATSCCNTVQQLAATPVQGLQQLAAALCCSSYWEIISHLGKGERSMDTVTESYTRRWRFRPGSELRWGIVLQTRTIFSGLVQSSNTDCGAMELPRWDVRMEVKMRGKWEEGSEEREIF